MANSTTVAIHMRFRFAAAVAFALVAVSADARSQPRLELISKCPDGTACLEMDLNIANLPQAIRDAGPIDRPIGPVMNVQPVSSEKDAMDFDIGLRGRLGDGTAAEYLARFRGYTGGLRCTDFGQGRVAVLGFSESSLPILLTDRGPFRLERDDIAVGCPECLMLVDKTTAIVRRVALPTWDGYSAPVGPGRDGSAYLMTGPSGREICIKSEVNRAFSVVERHLCRPPDLSAAASSVVERIRRQNALPLAPEFLTRLEDNLFDSPDLPFFVYRWAGACT